MEAEIQRANHSNETCRDIQLDKRTGRNRRNTRGDRSGDTRQNKEPVGTNQQK